MRKITKRIRDYEFQWHTDKELLNFFPEIKEMLPIKIFDLEQAVKEKEAEISGHLNRIEEMEVDNFSKWFGREVVKMEFMLELLKHDRELFRLKRYARLSNPGASKKISNFQEKLEVARSYPIYEVARQYIELKQTGNNFTGLCPFHNEKTPSFYIYTQQGTYHCFGCQAHGDVINLTMELHGVDFKNAVEILQK